MARWHVTTAVDKQQIVAPILAHPMGSHERAAAFRVAAGQQHRFGWGWVKFVERALRVWMADLRVEAAMRGA